MATTETIQIDTKSKEIHIKDLTIHDSDLADYIGEISEESRTDAVERALRVGVMTLQLGDTSKELEFVKSEFEQMQNQIQEDIDTVCEQLDETFGDDGKLSKVFDQHLGDDGTLQDHFDSIFGEDGEFTERLDEELGEDGERIKAALDPDVEGTPTHRLKSHLQEEIKQVRDKIEREEALEEAKQRSWEKGVEFEETVDDLLSNIVHGRTAELRHTGDEEGEIPGRDVGDFVVTLGETGQRIVVEAKSEKHYTQPKIKNEMEEAIENRDADYGIFVTECEDYVPDKIGYFQEYDQQILCVALCSDKEDDIEPSFLNIAYNWARMRLLQAHVDTGDTIDPEVVQSQVGEVRDTISRFSTVKTKCSDIQSTAEEIRELLDEIQSDVNDQLNTITSELSKAAKS